MAKANNTEIYNYKELPSLLDYLFGTDFNNNKKNKSFRLNSIIQLINNVNGINNTQFIFSDGSDSEVSYFDKGYFFTDNNETNPINFTKLILNKESLQPINLTLLFERLATIGNLIIKLENPANPNNFFNFRITAISDETDFFVFDVEIFEDFFFGELLNETIYSVYFDIKTDGVISDKLDKDGYPGTAKTLDDRISAVEFPDIVLKSATPIIQGLNISVPADSFEWRINQIVFDNTPGLSRTLTAASNGFYRKDVLLGTNTNSFLIGEGAEGDESVTPPTIFPEGTILLGVIDIFGNTTTGFLINDTSKVSVFGNGGETDYVEVNKLGSTLDVRNATSLTGFTIPSANIQYGKDYYLRNSTGGNLTLKSLIGSNSIRFYFPDGDLVVPLNNNVHLKYLSNNEFGGLGYLTLVGISYKDSFFPKIQFTANGTDLSYNLNTLAKAKAVFWNGALLDDADWEQINNTLTLTFTPSSGEIIKPI